ncbi:MAG: hypothetical protein AAGK17_07435 [Pseudomonadota bacterium]
MTISSVLLALSLQTAPVAEEPTQQTKPKEQIVVEAPPTKSQRRKVLKEMVTAIARKPRRGRTVPTFFEAICPKVVGVPEGAANVIAQRIADNAEQLGANRRDPSDPCTPNILVKFIPADKGKPSKWLKYDSDLLSHLLSYQRIWVLEEKDPVRAWNTLQVRSADGVALPDTARGKNFQVINAIWSGTRFQFPVRSEIRSAVVLIELASANGKTLEQLADYATMRTFASTSEIESETIPAASTILTLFQDEDAPPELTTFDRAFIKGLYSDPRNYAPNRYYSTIASTAVNMEIDEAKTLAQ